MHTVTSVVLLYADLVVLPKQEEMVFCHYRRQPRASDKCVVWA